MTWTDSFLFMTTWVSGCLLYLLPITFSTLGMFFQCIKNHWVIFARRLFCISAPSFTSYGWSQSSLTSFECCDHVFFFSSVLFEYNISSLRKCGIYTQWNFSSIRKNEILSFSSKWMELENIVLIEVSQAQMAKNCMFFPICRL
jgi:hypothetical protein